MTQSVEAGAPEGPPRTDESLPEEVRSLLVAFARALQTFGMYPHGHPSLSPAARSVAESLDGAAGERDEIELSVGPRWVAVEGTRTDPDHGLFSSLARRLYRHHLSALTLMAGADPGELSVLLAALSRDTEEEPALGLRFNARIPGCPHVRIAPVPYGALDISSEAEDPENGAAALWLDLARAALVLGTEGDPDAVPTDPRVLAESITEKLEEERGEEYAARVVERLLEAAKLFRGSTRREGADQGALGVLANRMTDLVLELSPGMLSQLLDRGGSPGEARQFLFDVSYQLDPDALESVVATVADRKFLQISSWLDRIFKKLTAHARSDDHGIQAEADRQMRQQVREMLGSWELENPNPTEYEQALSALAADSRRDGHVRLVKAEPVRIVLMALELDVSGPAVRRETARVEEAAGRLRVIRAAAGAPPERRAPRDVWEVATRPEWIRALLSGDETDLEAASSLLERCDDGVAAVLLDVLTESDSRSVRRFLYDRIVELGPGVGRQVVDRLADADWQVRRNLLGILSELEEVPDDFSPRPYLTDEHPEVRHVAVSLALRDPGTREAGLRAALDDPHSRTVILGLSAARDACPDELAPRVVARAVDADLDWEVRVHAIRALGDLHPTSARDALVRLAARRRIFPFWKYRLREPSRETLAAVRALAAGWARDPRAADVLHMARQAGDPELREAGSAATTGRPERGPAHSRREEARP